MEIRFKLNFKNEKDKVIIDLLNNQYDRNEFIKSILYRMAIEGSLGIEMDEYIAKARSTEGKIGKNRDEIINNEFSDFF